jgi:porphyrinogen peroxidase
MHRQPEPQAILTPLTRAAIFLVMTVEPGGEEAVRSLLSELSGLRRAVGFRRPEENLTCVAAIGASLWERLYDDPRPLGLHPLPEIAGDRHAAVSTPGDLLFHLRADRLDMCFELGDQITGALKGLVRAVDEVHGFRSFDDRDLLGFVDGTENPEGEDAVDAVLVGEEDLAHAGGSYVVVQKYLHDLDAWNELTVEQQELAIGRRKLNDIELDDDAKPSNSHVSLNTVVDDDGTEHKIVRLNMPFGRVARREFGTYFIGYSRTPELIERMLQNMFVGVPRGNHDRILDFSTPVTGTLFFSPSAQFLEGGEAGFTTPKKRSDADREPVGSLRLGGLRSS